MKKKSFRERQADGPQYPRLKDVNAGVLKKWGLAAVGGLLLGGAACTRNSGAPPATRNAELLVQKAAQARALQGLDAGGPAAPYLGPPGEPPMDRAELEKANREREAADKQAKAPKDRHRRAQETPPRLEDKQPGKK